jgi:hypothetical protein
MSLAIRRASLTEDRQELLELFKRNFSEFGENLEERFDYYQSKSNPAGEGWTWLLYDRSDGSAVGTTSLFRRNMYVDGKQLAVGQVMFFAVDAAYRSLGPAVMLQRATFDPVDRGEVAFCYDCPPHDEGMSTFVRLGMPPNCEMTRYVLPLRSDEYLGKKLGKGAWTRPVVASANLLLRLRTSRHSSEGLEVSEFDGDFGEEFSHLDKAVSSSGAVRICRSAEVLQWLCREFPLPAKRAGSMDGFRVLVARRAGELVAFLVFLSQLDNLVAIVDLFGSRLDTAARPLLEAVIEIAKQRKMHGVYGYCVAGSALSRVLESAGFRPRERAARVVAYEKVNGRGSAHLNSGLHWAFSQFELMR